LKFSFEIVMAAYKNPVSNLAQARLNQLFILKKSVKISKEVTANKIYGGFYCI